jgi:endoglycosylceramidase
MIDAIRPADRRTLIWYEPQVLFNYGSATNLPALGDPRLGFAFHNYCLAHDFFHTSQSCPTLDDLVFRHALARARSTGDALLETEFGATTDPTVLGPDIQRSDRDMVSWLEWHYCGCNDPTTSGPGSNQAIVLDPRKPPAGSNLNLPTLRLLVEPYPQLISGTPRSWGFDSSAKRFSLTYATARAAGGGSFPAGAVTEIATPGFVYPHGYAARVHGGAIVSSAGAATLRIAACPGMMSVTVTVTAASTAGDSCRARLRVSIAPRSAVLRRPTTFHIVVTAVLGAFRQRVAGALVYFGQRVARTDSRGEATIRVTLHRHIRRYGAVAFAPRFASGVGYISSSTSTR